MYAYFIRIVSYDDKNAWKEILFFALVYKLYVTGCWAFAHLHAQAIEKVRSAQIHHGA